MANEERQLEDQLQAQFWTYCWNNYPMSRGCIWAVPNGLQLPLLLALKAKATGLLEGVWDLHCFYKGQFYIIETKVGKNQLTKTRIDNRGKKHRGQEEWGELMASHGAKRFVYRTINEGIDILRYIFGEPQGTAEKAI